MKRFENEKDRQPGYGSLTIEDIELPLRTEYIFSMASKKDGGMLKLDSIVAEKPLPFVHETTS